MIRQLDDRTLVSGQVAPHEVAGLAEQGWEVVRRASHAGYRLLDVAAGEAPS